MWLTLVCACSSPLLWCGSRWSVPAVLPCFDVVHACMCLQGVRVTDPQTARNTHKKVWCRSLSTPSTPWRMRSRTSANTSARVDVTACAHTSCQYRERSFAHPSETFHLKVYLAWQNNRKFCYKQQNCFSNAVAVFCVWVSSLYNVVTVNLISWENIAFQQLITAPAFLRFNKACQLIRSNFGTNRTSLFVICCLTTADSFWPCGC